MSLCIVDTGSLLFLARLNRLELLEIGVDRVLVPPAVLIEIHRKEDPVLEIIRACYGDWLGECMINNLEILRLKSIGMYNNQGPGKTRTQKFFCEGTGRISKDFWRRPLFSFGDPGAGSSGRVG